MAELEEEPPVGGMNDAVEVYSLGCRNRKTIAHRANAVAVRPIVFRPCQTVRASRAASIECSESSGSNSFCSLWDKFHHQFRNHMALSRVRIGSGLPFHESTVPASGIL